MKITKEGFAVVEGDMLMSRYVEEQGRLDVGRALTDLMQPYIPVDGVVLDVGACIGDHTVAYASMVGEGGHVLAFEPNPIALECLRYNTRLLPQVTVCGFGLGDAVGTVDVKVDSYNLGATRLANYTDAGLHAPIRRLDDMDLAHIDFIKIDAEGYEPWILDGGRETLMRLRPTMLIEVQTEMLAHNRFTPDDIYSRLAEMGFMFVESKEHAYDLLVI